MKNSPPPSASDSSRKSSRGIPALMRTASLILGTCSLFLVGCVGYQKKWNRAVAAYEAGETSAPEGPWEGSWETTTNGHTGDLRAIVSRSEENPGEYDFHYHFTWAKILSGTYKATFPATRTGSSRHEVDGEQELGLFGTFRHEATITDNQFEATYSSKKGEVGLFEMIRPR